MLSITRRISPYNHSNGNDIKYIVMHYTGNNTDSASGNANYFNGGDRQASAHYFVDNNSIYQVVEDFNASWHCGDGHGQYGITNHNSIGIEMCCVNGSITEQTENNAIELVKYLMNKYSVDIDHVVRHYDASRKLCPNWQANNWFRWSNFKNKLKNGVIEEDEDDMNIKEIFCEEWYLQAYSDVKDAVNRGELTAKEHYNQYGKNEGRKPNCGIPANWNEVAYLYNNEDVNKNVSSGDGFKSGLHHYLIAGWNEPQRKDSWITPNIPQVNNQEDDSNKQIYYRIITGSFKERQNANEQINKLKNAGFDSFIDIYKK